MQAYGLRGYNVKVVVKIWIIVGYDYDDNYLWETEIFRTEKEAVDQLKFYYEDYKTHYSYCELVDDVVLFWGASHRNRAYIEEREVII